VTNETLVNLTQAARMIPGRSGDKPLHRSTLHRWMTKGAKTADGRVVRLESVRVGGQRMTTQEALRRFLDAMSGAGRAVPAPVEQAEIERQLDAIGI